MNSTKDIAMKSYNFDKYGMPITTTTTTDERQTIVMDRINTDLKGTGIDDVIQFIVMERSMSDLQSYYFELVRSMCDLDIMFSRGSDGKWISDYKKVWTYAESNPHRYSGIVRAINILERQNNWNLQFFACQVTGLNVPFMVLNTDEKRGEQARYLCIEMYTYVWDEDIDFQRTSAGKLTFTVDPDLILDQDLIALTSVVQQINDLEHESLMRLDLTVADDTGIADPTWLIGNTPVYKPIEKVSTWGIDIHANYALLHNGEVQVFSSRDEVKDKIAEITHLDFQKGLGSIFAVAVDPHGDLKPTDTMSDIVHRALSDTDICHDAGLSDYTWLNHPNYK